MRTQLILILGFLITVNAGYYCSRDVIQRDFWDFDWSGDAKDRAIQWLKLGTQYENQNSSNVFYLLEWNQKWTSYLYRGEYFNRSDVCSESKIYPYYWLKNADVSIIVQQVTICTNLNKEILFNATNQCQKLKDDVISDQLARCILLGIFTLFFVALLICIHLEPEKPIQKKKKKRRY